MSKARVEGCYEALPEGEYAIHWNARHECGWWEDTAYWHNAFWAADHHVRYDCGRREQVSSGGYAGPLTFARDITPAEADEIKARWEEAMRSSKPLFTVLDEGGMQNDPHPSDTGDPLPPESAEDATVELGCITAEVGFIDLGVCEEEGTEEGEVGDLRRGWWPWGRHVRAW